MMELNDKKPAEPPIFICNDEGKWFMVVKKGYMKYQIECPEPKYDSVGLAS